MIRESGDERTPQVEQGALVHGFESRRRFTFVMAGLDPAIHAAASPPTAEFNMRLCFSVLL
jgi:hypothetical protein